MIKGCWVIFEYMCKMSLMKWFLLNRLQFNLEPRKISLEQKYLAFQGPYAPSYHGPDPHRDLKKLTFPSQVMIYYWKSHIKLNFLPSVACMHVRRMYNYYSLTRERKTWIWLTFFDFYIWSFNLIKLVIGTAKKPVFIMKK